MTYGYGMTYQARSTAPASVHVVAILQYLGGLAALAVAAAAVYAATNLDLSGYDPGGQLIQPADLATLFFVGAAIFGLTGLLALLLGRKLQRGRQWARVVLILLNLLCIAGAVLQVLSGTGLLAGAEVPPADLLGAAAPVNLIGLAVPVLSLILLNTRAARSWFRARTY